MSGRMRFKERLALSMIETKIATYNNRWQFDTQEDTGGLFPQVCEARVRSADKTRVCKAMALYDLKGHHRLRFVILEVKQQVAPINDLPPAIYPLHGSSLGVECNTVLTRHTPHRRITGHQQVLKRWPGTTDKTGLIHTVVLDNTQGLLRLCLLLPEVKQPVAPINDLPTPPHRNDPRCLGIKRDTILLGWFLEGYFTYRSSDSYSCTGDIIIFTQLPDRIAGIHLGTDEVPTRGCISGDTATCLIASALAR